MKKTTQTKEEHIEQQLRTALCICIMKLGGQVRLTTADNLKLQNEYGGMRPDLEEMTGSLTLTLVKREPTKKEEDK